MTERNLYDQELREVRMKMAMKKTEWYKFFKIREKYVGLTILSFIVVWIVLGTLFLFLGLNSIYLFVLPNLVWIFLVAPFFGIKIIHLSNIINIKKEELIVNLWKTKTQEINEIMALSGIDEIFVEYYLIKNELLPKSAQRELNSLK